MREVRAGDVISTGWFPEAVQAEDDTFNLNISSTSYIAGTPENGVSFIAPLSGKVGLVVSGDIRQNDVSFRLFMTVEVYEGSDSTGTLLLAGDATRGISTHGEAGEAMSHGNMSLLEGLTPGDTYFARNVFRVDGVTTDPANDVFFRRVAVIPMP